MTRHLRVVATLGAVAFVAVMVSGVALQDWTLAITAFAGACWASATWLIA